ncbi:MAG TPA: radical SAM protein [Terriglobia bacterium]|nr:radical SAM protein [Terriglobia bacterium]
MEYKAELNKIFHSLTRKKKLGTVIFFVTSACNARCRTCFYWQELNQRGDLTWDEIQRLSRSMPPFTDLWLSGGEPMLRRELAEIIRLFHVNNGIRWVNLPTNGLLPERTADWVERICSENPALSLDLNVAMDGLDEMQDSIRAVPGNFQKTLQTLEAVQPCRRKFPNLRLNINTVICAENFDQVLAIAEFVKRNCPVDGHYFNIIRGEAKDASLKRIPAGRLPALYRELQKVYAHYAGNVLKRHQGIKRRFAEVYYQGTLALHNKIQLENIESPHPWPMPCTAGETAIVIDYNGDVRACELRGKLANLRDYDCDFRKFWQAQVRQEEVEAIVRDQCWCTHVCFIHDSLRYSPKALLYDIPVTYLDARLRSGEKAAPLSRGHVIPSTTSVR